MTDRSYRVLFSSLVVCVLMGLLGAGVVNADVGIVEDFAVDYAGAHRGTGVDQKTGRVYISNTTTQMVHYFEAGNETGTPDGSFTHPDWQAFLGPYGVDVALDGKVYVVTYRGDVSGVYQYDPDTEIVKLVDSVGVNLRGLAVVGEGEETVIYFLDNDGGLYRATTTDGNTFTHTKLFDTTPVHNASIAPNMEGSVIYTVGFGQSIVKWDAAGNADPGFVSPTIVNAAAIRLNSDGSALYVLNDTATDNFLKLDPTTGAVLDSVTLGFTAGGGNVLSFDIAYDNTFYWAYNGGRRGMATDTTAVRLPYADPGADQLVVAGTEVTLDGSGSVDPGGEPLTYTWGVISSPEAVVLSDPNADLPTFTPASAGTYVFELVVNNGTASSLPRRASVEVTASDFYEAWYLAYAGPHRGTGTHPVAGRTFISLASGTANAGQGVYAFNHDNMTDMADGVATHPDWPDFIGPYGVDVADDGWVYTVSFRGSTTSGLYRVDPRSYSVEKLLATDPSRGLAAYGSGVNTVVYYLTNDGGVHKVTTDGSTWSDQLLFTNAAAQNASIAVTGDESTIYTAGFYSPVAKWDASGTRDAAFNQGVGVDTALAVAVRLNSDDSKLYAIHRDSDSTLAFASVDLATGDVLSQGTFGPANAIQASVVSFDIFKDREFFWASSSGYRGQVLDITMPDVSVMPFADAGPDQRVQEGTPVTLDGSGSTDGDDDALSYQWSVVSSPEAVTLSDVGAEMPTFTPSAVGDYVFALVVNDGTQDSDPDTSVVTVFSKDLFLTFDDPATIDEELANWDGDLNDDGASDGFTAVGWDTTGGIEGGALDISDGGFGLAIERGLRTTGGTPWTLSAYVKVTTSTGATPTELTLQVVGNVPSPVTVDIKDAADWTKVELSGFSIADEGRLQVVGSMPFQSGVLNHVLVDSLIFDDDAAVATVTVSGTVTLSDNPADMSGSQVSLVGYEPFLVDSTDAAGAYSISGVVAGTYDVLAQHFAYKDSLVAAALVRVDTTIDFTLNLNQPPVADAGADQGGVVAGTVVSLDGSGSSDPDGDELSYMWRLVAFPEAANVLDTTIINPDQAMAQFRATQLGSYTFELVVSDGTADSSPDSVIVVADQPVPFDYAYEDRGEFPGATTNVHGVGVDPEGKVWIASFGGSASLVVKNPDGSDASFSPVTFGLIGTDTVSTRASNRGIEVGPDGDIYFSTSTSGGVGVLKFDYRDGTPLGGFARSASPTKVGVDGDGNIFIADVVTGATIDIYNANFEQIGSIDVSTAAGLPSGIISRAVDVSADGSTVLLSDIVNGGRIYKFTGSVAGGYTYDGEVPGPFLSVQGIEFDGSGRLWAGDYEQLVDGRQFIHVYDPDFEFRQTFVVDLYGPRGFGFTNDDSLVYVIGFDGHMVKRFAVPGSGVPTLLTPLADARANDENGRPLMLDQVVRVRGIVTVVGEFADTSLRGPGNIQAADGSAGMSVFSADFVNAVARGDEVVVEGKVSFFNGLTEIVDPVTVTVLSQNNTVEPMDITTADLADTTGENYEGILVRVRRVTINTTSFAGNTNYTITDSAGSAELRVDRDTNIPGSSVVADTFDVVGVVGQFDSSEPYWSGYQLLPRDKFDMAEATDVASKPSELPRRFALYQNYPNPFNPSTTIRFDVPKQANVRITVYNVLGQQVRALVNKEYAAGAQSIIWDARNDVGQKVSSGLYFYMIEAGKKDGPSDFVKVLQMTLLK